MARNRVTSGALGKSKKTGRIGSCSARRTGLREVHVLAVDDSIIDRKVIERLLKISSCKVTAVDSGRRALQFLGLEERSSPAGSNASHPRNSECREIHEPDVNGLKVDLIITDYCMPGMTGFELLKKVKESSALREIPVVIVSSEKTSAHMDRCLQEGAEEFLVKPVKLSDVKRLRSYTNRGIQDRCSASRKRKRPDSHSPVSPELSLSLKSPPPAV